MKNRKKIELEETAGEREMRLSWNAQAWSGLRTPEVAAQPGSLGVVGGSLPPLPPSAHASKVYDGYTGRSYWEVWLLGKNVRKLSASLSLSEARTKARQRLAAEAEENIPNHQRAASAEPIPSNDRTK